MYQVAPCQTQRNALRGQWHGIVPELECQMVVRPRNQSRRDVPVAFAADQYHLRGHSVEVVAIDIQPAASFLNLGQIERKGNRITNSRFDRAHVVGAKPVSESQQRRTCPGAHEVDAAPEIAAWLRRTR